jgi:two-component system nitrate/nitrite response regulator NarL
MQVCSSSGETDPGTLKRLYMANFLLKSSPRMERTGLPSVHVLIADDHSLIRQGLIGLLSDVFPAWQFSEADDLATVQNELENSPPELLVIDLGMPGMSGRTTLRDLRIAHPDLKIAVLTGRDDPQTILDCLSAGVHGYILKVDASDQLLLAVKTILAGGIYVPAALSQIMATAGMERRPEAVQVAPAQPKSMPGLTGRQQEVLELLAEGRSTKDIARRLQLGIGTVKVHLTGVYRALGARNRTEAVAKAIAVRAHEPTGHLC